VAWGGPEAGAGDALGDDVAGAGGAGIEPRVPTSGALRTEAATVAAIREALACEGAVAAPVALWANHTTDGQRPPTGTVGKKPGIGSWNAHG
jgi:hypothetical protein